VTPIQYFLVLGRIVYSVDFAFLRRQVAVCATEDGATWLGWSLGQAHKREVRHGESEAAGHRSSRELPDSPRIGGVYIYGSGAPDFFLELSGV